MKNRDFNPNAANSHRELQQLVEEDEHDDSWMSLLNMGRKESSGDAASLMSTKRAMAALAVRKLSVKASAKRLQGKYSIQRPQNYLILFHWLDPSLCPPLQVWCRAVDSAAGLVNGSFPDKMYPNFLLGCIHCLFFSMSYQFIPKT